MKVKKKRYFCYKVFEIPLSRAMTGRGKFCSRKCTDNYKVKFMKVKNKNNPSWKGKNVSYNGLHRWLRRNMKKYGICVLCGKNTKTDWASLTRKYKRGKDEYIELCRKCHAELDWGHWTNEKGEKIPMFRVPEVEVIDI